MQRLSKIIRKTNYIPEFGYLVVVSDGMIAYNGEIGIKYAKSKIGERLCKLVDDSGPFAIPDPSNFIKAMSALQEIKEATLSTRDSSMQIRFGSKGSVKIPVVLNLSEHIPHLAIKWQEFNPENSDIEVNSLWEEISNLITAEGESLWGDIVGVYGSGNKLVSFDFGVYLHSEEMNTGDFYCPRGLTDLGLKHIQYAKILEDTVFLVGKDVQYVCSSVAKSEVVKEMMKLKDQFSDGDLHKVTLDLTMGVWKRAKLFASSVLTFKVKNSQIYLEHDSWSESIGKTSAPDAEFTTRLSLLSRWASGTFEHSISIAADSTWNLFGKTRGGLSFYAVLTDVASDVQDTSKDTNEFPDFAEDLEEGASLL